MFDQTRSNSFEGLQRAFRSSISADASGHWRWAGGWASTCRILRPLVRLRVPAAPRLRLSLDRTRKPLRSNLAQCVNRPFENLGAVRLNIFDRIRSNRRKVVPAGGWEVDARVCDAGRHQFDAVEMAEPAPADARHFRSHGRESSLRSSCGVVEAAAGSARNQRGRSRAIRLADDLGPPGFGASANRTSGPVFCGLSKGLGQLQNVAEPRFG